MADSQSCGPFYPDILVSSNTSINDDVRYNVLTKQWPDLHLFKFPARLIGSTSRRLQPHWFVRNSWLRYSPSTDSVYCAPCRFFGPQSSGSKEKAFGTTPITDWSNLGKLITRHEVTKSHQSSLVSSNSFLKITDGKAKDVVCKLSDGYESVVAKNRHILKCIIETIILCGNQGLALRGHSEEDGNFARLLQYRSKDNSNLREHLLKPESKCKYTSPDIQNEIIEICGDMIVDDVVRDCNKSPCFGFIADEATDCSTIEQMALCVRFFDNNKGIIREEFLGFAECNSTTGEALTDGFLQNLTAKGVVIQNMRGQGYDGAANMSGKYRGVQARVKQVVPHAEYTHCKAHNLNLCIIHACKEPLVRNVMDTIQTIAFAFDYSAKRLMAFNEALDQDELARGQMDNRRKLKTLCETRWASRSDALFTFKTSLTTVHTALLTLADGGDSKARSYHCSISKFDFIITLVATEHVLSGLINLSTLLQKKECDLLVAVEETKVVKRMINNERNDPAVWDALYECAVDIAALIDVEPSFPRLAQIQRHRPNIAANDASTYWRQNMYLPFVDHLLSELDIRLLNAEPRYSAQYLIPQKLVAITDDLVNTIFDTYSVDLDVTRIMFHREIQRWKTRWAGAIETDQPSSLTDTIKAANQDLYPSIYMILCVLASMPVSTATAERSFSVMRRVKSYLRNTMTTNRLSGLGLLNVYREKELNSEDLLNNFVRKKNRKLALIFE